MQRGVAGIFVVNLDPILGLLFKSVMYTAECVRVLCVVCDVVMCYVVMYPIMCDIVMCDVVSMTTAMVMVMVLRLI